MDAAERGADFLLVNPIHAAEVVPPIEPSPIRSRTKSVDGRNRVHIASMTKTPRSRAASATWRAWAAAAEP